MRDQFMPDMASTAAAGFAVKSIGLAGLAGIAAGAVAIALTPPKSTKEFARRLIVTVLTSVFAGPLAVERFGMQDYTLASQVGVCFMVGVPSWLIWSYIAYWLERSQKKSPAELADDLRKIKGGK